LLQLEVPKISLQNLLCSSQDLDYSPMEIVPVGKFLN